MTKVAGERRGCPSAWRVAALTASCLFASGLLAAAHAGERYAIVVSGASGGAKYAALQKKWCDDLLKGLTTTYGIPDSNIVVLREENEGTSRSTAENVRRLFADLRRRITREDTLLVVLFGHGTFDGADAKFNLVGPDLAAREWNELIDPVSGLVVVVNTTESSFPFMEELSRRGRVVITATDSAAQRFTTIFPEYFVRAMSETTSDLDRNGRISVWEAFAAASAGVKQHYEQRGQLSIERPVLDDDGDGIGQEAQAPGSDGVVARAVFLDAETRTETGDAVLAGLERQRAALVAQIEALMAKKASMSEEEYQAELELLFVQLARLAQLIRERS
jgi:hypothetical protein